MKNLKSDHWSNWLLYLTTLMCVVYTAFILLLCKIHMVTSHFCKNLGFCSTFLALKQIRNLLTDSYFGSYGHSNHMISVDSVVANITSVLRTWKVTRFFGTAWTCMAGFLSKSSVNSNECANSISMKKQQYRSLLLALLPVRGSFKKFVDRYRWTLWMLLTLCHWLVPSFTTVLHNLLLDCNWAINFVCVFSLLV